MRKNIFDLYREVKKTPFKARRTHWGNEDIYVLITEVKQNSYNNYGTAKHGGVFDGNNKLEWYGFESKKVPNSGVYSWELYEDGV